MAKRGRKAGSNAPSTAEHLTQQFLKPPRDLTAAQKKIWKTTVESKPVEWFTDESIPMLSQYAAHVATARFLTRQIDALESSASPDADQHRKLCEQREKETRAITALARSMRLTQQSRYKAEVASTAAANFATGRMPWETK